MTQKLSYHNADHSFAKMRKLENYQLLKSLAKVRYTALDMLEAIETKVLNLSRFWNMFG